MQQRMQTTHPETTTRPMRIQFKAQKPHYSTYPTPTFEASIVYHYYNTQRGKVICALCRVASIINYTHFQFDIVFPSRAPLVCSLASSRDGIIRFKIRPLFRLWVICECLDNSISCHFNPVPSGIANCNRRESSLDD